MWRFPTYSTLTAVDPVLSVATVQLGDQAGATLDTVTREVLNAGTSVIYVRLINPPVIS